MTKPSLIEQALAKLKSKRGRKSAADKAALAELTKLVEKAKPKLKPVVVTKTKFAYKPKAAAKVKPTKKAKPAKQDSKPRREDILLRKDRERISNVIVSLMPDIKAMPEVDNFNLYTFGGCILAAFHLLKSRDTGARFVKPPGEGEPATPISESYLGKDKDFPSVGRPELGETPTDESDFAETEDTKEYVEALNKTPEMKSMAAAAGAAFDDGPTYDPLKPSCSNCSGHGVVSVDNIQTACPKCGGSGNTPE